MPILNETDSSKSKLAFDYDSTYDILYIHLLDKKGNPSYGEETDYGIKYRDIITDEVVGYSISWFKKRLDLWDEGKLFYV